MSDIVPNRFWSFPARFRLPSLLEDDEDWQLLSSAPSGLSISEDDKNVYVEAAVPGVDPADIEITFDKGLLYIHAEAKEEEENKKKKYYRKATAAFAYRVAVPGDVDLSVEPEAACKNGIMTITFAKIPASQPKKIHVKTK